MLIHIFDFCEVHNSDFTRDFLHIFFPCVLEFNDCFPAQGNKKFT